MFLLRSLGFSINCTKVIDPTIDITFLGIRIDSVRGILSPDPHKTNQIVALLQWPVTKDCMSRSQLERLIGKLSWASNAISWDRTRLCQTYLAIGLIKHASHKPRVASLKADWLWWHDALVYGHLSRQIWDQHPKLQAFADATTVGGGVFHNGSWAYVNWRLDSGLQGAHINAK